MTRDDAFWALLGEAVIGFAPRPRRLMPLPHGLNRMPGPAVIICESFIDSPVGPFVSLEFGEPVRIGVHVGIYFGVSVVNNAHARRSSRQYWGFPQELGSLHWINEGRERGVIWDERGIEVRGDINSGPLPFLVPFRIVQKRSDGPVVIPGWIRSLARRSRVRVGMTAEDPLISLAGEHRGLALSGMVMRRNAARRPLGLFSTLRAPLRAPEPGVIGMDHASGAVTQPGLR